VNGDHYLQLAVGLVNDRLEIKDAYYAGDRLVDA